ncbi:putative acyl-coenzyme A thioesterase 9, mitochondrial-like [Ditylenchus destructor]|uniref:Acyl-coenzyme A thioesterase 9, mitochondrial-like n=1 Tax=Ditylenchus destructor TaxID=166010 RepID=A0AAD4MXZ2_9BILA|nr:putative acyl-coenzyme A thioesterase 9, mitochondrial-like [Ditylenchus destructor]
MLSTALRSARALAVQVQHVANNPQLLTIKQINDVLAQHVAALPEAKDISHDPKKAHSVADSIDSVVIPLGSEPQIRLQYVNNLNITRFGKILEDLDTFAVWLSYKHNQGPEVPMGTPNHPPMIAVTACVDKINLQNRVIRSDLDIIMSGMVTWVGRSSAEITMHLAQKYGENDLRDVLTARFVMVSMEPGGKKAVPNVALKLETDEDRAWFEKGEYAKKVRMSRELNSLFKTPPTEIERTMIHDLFLKAIDPSNMAGKLPPNHVWMRDAKLENLVICYPVKRNLYGKIFGGYLMRTAFETALANAAILSKCIPQVMAVDSVMFRKSVEIGSLLLLSSQVCYSADRFMQLAVNAQVLDVEKGDLETTNTFQFTFKANKEVPTVMPRSYADGMLYLGARRHFDSSAHETIFN